jgi:hypothetical protein
MTNKSADAVFGLVANPAKADTQVGVNVSIPYDLHRQLKIKQIQLDLSLPEAIVQAIEAWVA